MQQKAKHSDIEKLVIQITNKQSIVNTARKLQTGAPKRLDQDVEMFKNEIKENIIKKHSALPKDPHGINKDIDMTIKAERELKTPVYKNIGHTRNVAKTENFDGSHKIRDNHENNMYKSSTNHSSSLDTTKLVHEDDHRLRGTEEYRRQLGQAEKKDSHMLGYSSEKTDDFNSINDRVSMVKKTARYRQDK